MPIDSFGWLADGHGHVQGAQGQILFHPVAQRPADHAPRIQIQDDSKTGPSLAGPNIGYISRPFLVWRSGGEIPTQQILRDFEAMIAVGRAFELPALPDLDAQFVELLRHARTTVADKAQAVLFVDMSQQDHIPALTT